MIIEQPPVTAAPDDLLDIGLLQFLPPILTLWPGFVDDLEHEAFTLFIDVAGFTTLSEMLARLGAEGAEILEATIARYFDALLDVVEAYGGIPIKVAGDALTVVFRVDPDAQDETARRVLQCAAELRHAGFEVGRVKRFGVEFTLAHKIGVGGGSLLSAQVGDPRLRAELVFAGASIDRAAEAEHHASAGEVWVAPEVASLFSTAELFSSEDRQGFRCLRADVLLGASERVPPSPARLTDREATLLRFRHLLPPAVRQHAAEGTLNYISRHQNVAVMFVSCPRMSLERPESLSQLDAHYRLMQQLVEQYGGFLSEFEAGDKGAKLVVLFGATSVLEDPSGQAARCAQAMQLAAREHGLVTDQRIGMAVGRLYVGRIGCRDLMRFAALGDRMNLAARLMTKASRWMVLAERRVAEQSSRAVRWGPPRAIRVKGKKEPIFVCAMKGARSYRIRERRGVGIIGRVAERRSLKSWLSGMREASRGGLLVLLGPAGSGKTRLAEFVHLEAGRCGVRVVRWSGVSGPHAAPLSAWRPLLLDLAGCDDRVPADALQARYQSWLGALPEELQRAAEILAPLAGVECPEDPILSRLPPEQLLTLRRQSLIDCLMHATVTVPRVFILDNAELMDSQSIRLLADLAPLLETFPFLVVAAQRPEAGESRGPFASILALRDVETFMLQPLSAADAARLACRRLKVGRLDSELEALLQSRAQGNPLLIEAWIDFLRDHGRVLSLDDVAFLSGTRRLQALPDRLEALILAQLERLPSAARLSVEVASIIGPALTPADVAALHPEGVEEREVAAHLRLGSQAGVLSYDRGNQPRMFFSRPEVLEAIHDSLPFHFRRMLHTRRAHQLETDASSDLDDDLVLDLARHHEYIDDPAAQRRIFARACSVCAERFDHRGTVRWARRLIDACDRQGDPAGGLAVAARLGSALELLGEVEERRQVLDRWVHEAEAAGDLRSLVHALRTRARARHFRGEQESALEEFDRALAVARSLNDPELVTDTLINLCSVHGEAGQNLRMIEVAEEALRCVPEGDSARLVKILGNRGVALEQIGQPSKAYENYVTALRLCEAAGDVWRESIMIGNIAVVLWAMDRPEEGHASFFQALELKRKVGDRREIALGLLNVGFSYYRLGGLARARSYTEDALRLFVRIGYRRGEIFALINLGEILWLTNALEEAARSFDRAQALLSAHPHAALQTELWIRQGELALARQDWSMARTLFERALERALAAGAIDFECNALEGLAETNAHAGNLAEAENLIRSALWHLEAGRASVSFPQRIWWRAARLASLMGRGQDELEFRSKAYELLERQQNRLRSTAARHRLVRAFPWNREIARYRGPGGSGQGGTVRRTRAGR